MEFRGCLAVRYPFEGQLKDHLRIFSSHCKVGASTGIECTSRSFILERCCGRSAPTLGLASLAHLEVNGEDESDVVVGSSSFERFILSPFSFCFFFPFCFLLSLLVCFILDGAYHRSNTLQYSYALAVIIHIPHNILASWRANVTSGSFHPLVPPAQHYSPLLLRLSSLCQPPASLPPSPDVSQ